MSGRSPRHPARRVLARRVLARRARPRPTLLGVALLGAAASGVAPLGAQAYDATRPSAWVGVGSAVPLSQPGAARGAGAAAVLGLDVPLVADLATRLELAAHAQSLTARASGPLRGDHHHLRTIALARWTPASVGRAAPYVLAGGGVFWQSDRHVLLDLSNPVPDAAFRQTTSRTAWGTLLGAGATATVARTRIFAEVRWTRLGGRDGGTTDLGLLAGVAVPIAP